MAQPAPVPLPQLVATFQTALPALQAVLPAFQALQPQNLAGGLQNIITACQAVINVFQNVIPGVRTIHNKLLELRFEVNRAHAQVDNLQAGLNRDFMAIGPAPAHAPIPPLAAGIFPRNMRDLLHLSVPRADALIASWGLAMPHPATIANKRILVAKYIGVRIPE